MPLARGLNTEGQAILNEDCSDKLMKNLPLVLRKFMSEIFLVCYSSFLHFDHTWSQWLFWSSGFLAPCRACFNHAKYSFFNELQLEHSNSFNLYSQLRSPAQVIPSEMLACRLQFFQILGASRQHRLSPLNIHPDTTPGPPCICFYSIFYFNSILGAFWQHRLSSLNVHPDTTFCQRLCPPWLCFNSIGFRFFRLHILSPLDFHPDTTLGPPWLYFNSIIFWVFSAAQIIFFEHSPKYYPWATVAVL